MCVYFSLEFFDFICSVINTTSSFLCWSDIVDKVSKKVKFTGGFVAN